MIFVIQTIFFLHLLLLLLLPRYEPALCVCVREVRNH